MIEALSSFLFLRPWCLLLLLWPLWLLLRRRTDSRVDGDWQRVVDAPLLRALSGAASSGTSHARAWGQALALTVAVVALAGPSWRMVPQPMQSNRAALVVVVDLSQGMLAADQKPSRLQHARFRLLDLLALRKEGQTALVAYAGAAFTVAPLTDDQATLSELVRGLDPAIMPLDGNNLADGLRLAGELLQQAGAGRGDVLVVTYGADAAAVNAAETLRAAGHRVSVFALGSESGAPIPLPGGGFVRDGSGSLVMSRADLGQLGALAGSGGGSLLPAMSEAGQLLSAVGAEHLDADTESTSDALLRIDDGPWLVLLLLPLMAWQLVRGRAWLAALVLVLGWPQPSQAMSWDSLWLNDDQRAHRALLEDDAGKARELARNPALKGSAAYRDGDFGAAAEAFAEARDDADAQYNRGNALARGGALQEAIAAYDEALARAPDMEDAAYNKALVEEMLRQQQSSDSQQDPSQDQDSQSSQSPQQGQGDDASQGEDSSQEGDDEGKQGESSESQDQQSGDSKDGQDQPSDGETSDAADSADQQPSDPGQESRDALSKQIDQALQQSEAQQQESGEADAKPDPQTALSAEELERAQATDQWLRRIPDDPSGLLRRKFAIEYRRRLANEEQP
ncbi:MAG: VWA domain-containing protein [Xanthomonadales bacterium]|nr:VWA domain-containing protein [Xanthomonadales bacterium]